MRSWQARFEGRGMIGCAVWLLLGCGAGCSPGTAVSDVEPDPGPVQIGDAGVGNDSSGTDKDGGATSDGGSTDDASTQDTPAVALAPLSLNEIAAQGTPLPGGFNPTGGDWAELYNSTDAAIDLTGYRIASTSKPFADAHPLPPGTSVASKGFLVIYFNHDNAGSPVVDDKLKGSADSSLQLWTPDGKVVDSVTWKTTQVIKGGSLGRTPDGANSWKLYAKVDATPGKPNK